MNIAIYKTTRGASIEELSEHWNAISDLAPYTTCRLFASEDSQSLYLANHLVELFPNQVSSNIIESLKHLESSDASMLDHITEPFEVFGGLSLAQIYYEIYSDLLELNRANGEESNLNIFLLNGANAELMNAILAGISPDRMLCHNLLVENGLFSLWSLKKSERQVEMTLRGLGITLSQIGQLVRKTNPARLRLV